MSDEEFPQSASSPTPGTVAAVGVVGLTHSSEEAGTYKVLSDLEPLRADFNAHSDSVRAVLLASPT